MTKLRTYTVECSIYGEFPDDMLRHDDATPVGEDDKLLIKLLNERDMDELTTRTTEGNRKYVRVQLQSEWRGSPNVARWESFGCKVVWCDDPTVELSTARRAADTPLAGRLRAKELLGERQDVREARVVLGGMLNEAADRIEALAKPDRCATCAHWKPEVDWEFEALSMGMCERIRHRRLVTSEEAVGVEQTFEDNDPYPAAAEAALKGSTAFLSDREGFHAALHTFADFGCVLHEDKEGAAA